VQKTALLRKRCRGSELKRRMTHVANFVLLKWEKLRSD
jgi:hypothetical protein